MTSHLGGGGGGGRGKKYFWLLSVCAIEAKIMHRLCGGACGGSTLNVDLLLFICVYTVLLYSPRWYKIQHSCDVVVSNPANKKARISSCTSTSVSLYLDSGSCALNNNVNKSLLSSPSSSPWRCLIICLTRLSRTLWC